MRRYSSYNSSQKSTFTPRSVRRYEKRARNRFFFTIGATILILVAFLIWGLPIIIGGLTTFNKFKATDKTPVTQQDAAIAPPTLNIPFEATNSANLTISGYSTPNLKVEIYFNDSLETTVTTDSGGNFQASNLSLSVGQNDIYGRTVNSLGNKSLPSKTISLLYNNEKPTLNVSSPSDGSQIKGGDKKVTVAGTTSPQDSITVNGITAIVDNSGNFSTTISINDGDNTIAVVATDSFGNTNEVDKKVNYSAS